MSGMAFFRKEVTEIMRRKKALIIAIVFAAFALLGIGTALLTPKILDMVAEEMASQGIAMVPKDVTAMDAWMQFFKNIDIPLIVMVLMWAGCFTEEYRRHTLVPLVTKGLKRTDIFLSKVGALLCVWTAGYGLYFLLSYGYTLYYWSDRVPHIIPAVLLEWAFGIWIIGLWAFFSSIASGSFQVLLGVGGVYFLCTFLTIIPKTEKYLPIRLSSGLSLLEEKLAIGDFVIPLCVAGVCFALCIAGGLACIQKKSI